MHGSEERNRPLLQVDHQDARKERQRHYFRRLHEAFLQLAPAQQSMSYFADIFRMRACYYLAYLASRSGFHSYCKEIRRVGFGRRAISTLPRRCGDLHGLTGEQLRVRQL